MNYMEREQIESDGFAKLILKHAGIIRQNYLVIIMLTVLGLGAGIFIQQSATDTYIKEVLLKNGNGLHLRLISDLMRLPTVIKRDPNKADRNGFAGTPQELIPLNLQIVKRVANSTGAKSSAILGLPKDHRLRKSAETSEKQMVKIIKKFKISSLTRSSDEILIRFDGKSIGEAEQVVATMIDLLRQQFKKMEQKRIEIAINSKLLVINSQITAKKNALKAALLIETPASPAIDIEKLVNSDASLTALNLEKQRFRAYPIDQVKIEPFIVVPIDTSKKVSFVKSLTWLVLTSFAGLFAGLLLCYGLYGYKQLKNA